MRKPLMIAVLLFCIAAAGIFITQARERTSHASKNPAQEKGIYAQRHNKKTSSLKDWEGRTRCRFSPGQRLAYEGESQSRLSLDLNALLASYKLKGSQSLSMAAPEAQEIQSAQRWHLELEAIAVQPDDSTILAASVRIDELQSLGAPKDLVAPDITEPFLIRLSERCAIEAFAWQLSSPRSVLRDQQSFTAALDFTTPPDPQTPSYNAKGFDSTGHYLTRYKAHKDGKIEGKKQRYDALFNQQEETGEAKAKAKIRDSTLSVQLGAGPWLERIETSRALRFEVRGISIGSLDASDVITRVEPEDWQVDVDINDPSWVWGVALEKNKKRKSKSNPTKYHGLENVSIEDALGRLIAFAEDGKHTPTDYATYMRDWIRAHPEAVPLLTEMIRRGKFDEYDKARSALFYALGAANTPESRAALMELFNDPDLRPRDRLASARALTLTDPPPPGYVEDLIAKANDGSLPTYEKNAMGLTLGMFANEHKSHNPELAQVARNEVERWLEQPGDERSLRNAISSAGNIGDDSLLEDLEPYLDHESMEVRQDVVNATRNMSPEVAMPLLEAAYRQDSEVAVRMEALEITRRMMSQGDYPLPDSMLDAVVERFAVTEDPNEYKRLIDVLGAASKQGNERADEQISARFDEEVNSGDPDPTHLRLLGRYHNTTWRAQNN